MLNDFHIVVLMISSLLILLAGLTFTVWVDPYISRGHRRTMLAVAAVILSLIAQNVFGYLLDVDGTKPFARTLVGIFGYSMRPVVLALLFYIVSPRKNRRWVWALVGVNALIHLTALFSGVCFSIDAANHFHRGPLGYSCHIVSGILLIQLLALTLREYRRERKIEALIPVFNAVIIILSVALDSFVDYREYPVSYLTMAVVVGNVFFYIWLHLQFVREHEQALRAEQRIQIMMTQIQPHFLYNTIATIRALCRRDADRAGEVAEKFGDYLRQNLDSLGIVGLIPFGKELEHTRVYAEIEMVRFDNVRVEYDIRDEAFSVPPLTLQPLVENAIRHGVRGREEGVVRVSTRRGEGFHAITVWDNGTGFDTAKIDAADGSHIGIRSVRERIEGMCGGAVKVESVIDAGTTVTIEIPLREKDV